MGRYVPALLGVALALLLALGYAFFSGRRMASSPAPPPAIGSQGPRGPSPMPELDAPEAGAYGLDAVDITEARTEAAAGAAVSEGDASLACIVLGRVVDEHDRPVVGASVRLQAYGAWTEGVDAPRLSGPNDSRGFEVETDALGDFRIAAPVPTAERTWLTIEPDPYHDSYRVTFGGERRDARPLLTAGERDLGVLRVATTGAVRGRVTDASGQPLADVTVGVGPGPSLTYGREARTAADGTYLVAHAPVGTYGVKARTEGFLAQFLEPVTVEAARDTLGVDFVLAPAPTIEGLVRDEAGQPLAGTRLWGWPATSGRGAGARSDAQGRFVVSLPQDEPYTLSAKLEGYRAWGDEHDKSVTHPPGTRDLEIVLESIPHTRFLVVDDETGEPVERFGLEILEDNGSRAPRRVHTERRPPRQDTHPGGVVERTARPGIDLYLVAADGYLIVYGDVEHEAPESPRQVVRLRRGARLVGRVLLDGEPLASAAVDVERGSMRTARGAAPGDAAPRTFRAHEHTLRLTVTGADGRFELAALERGTYRLTARPDRGAPLVVVPLEVRGRGTTDAGDLSVVSGAAIRGLVLTPPGVAPGGLTVWLDDWREGRSAVTDSEGAFGFEDLSAGVHALTLDDRPGELAGSGDVTVELTSGETIPVTLDARDRGTCRVTVVIDLGGLPALDRQIDLVSEADPPERATLGKCDEAGRVTGHPRAWGAARVVMWLPGRRLEHPTARLWLERGSAVEETLRFEPASVTLVLPAGVEPPAAGRAVLNLRAPNAEAVETAWLAFRDGHPNATVRDVARAEPGLLWFGYLPAGTFELTLELVDDTVEAQRVAVAGGGHTYVKPAYWEATCTVELRAGEDVRVVLE